MPFGRNDCSEVQSDCCRLSECPNYHERKTRQKKNPPIIKAKPNHPLTVMTSPLGCILKLLNNSYSHTSCFYSRRLRPQTPQGSDDEGGKSTLTSPPPIRCLSSRAKKSPPVSPRHIHPLEVEQISRRSDHRFSLMLTPYFSLSPAWIHVLERCL